MNFVLISICLIISFLLFFYRYPFWLKQVININNNFVYSPAFGKIMTITKEKNGDVFIAIFLSPLDVHYQFSPIDGHITQLDYDANGKFELSYNLNKSKDNEKSIYTIESSRGTFKVFQIAGKLVRRITTFKKPQDNVKTGDPLGLIHFGSRVDIIIPNSTDTFKINVQIGDRVNNQTVLGMYS
jgi:phosphatidylserine decarboxylase